MSEIYVQKKESHHRSDITFAFVLAFTAYLLWLTRDVLLLLYVSALFAVVLAPLLNLVMRIRIKSWQPGRGIAILVLFLAAGLFFSLFFLFALPPVLTDMREFLKDAPRRVPQLLSRVQALPIMRHVDMSSVNAKLQDFASNFAGYMLVTVQKGAGKLASIVTGVILTVYFVLEGDTAYRWMLSFLPDSPRRRLDRTLIQAEGRMGKWLLGQGLLMLILGTASTIAFLFIHIRYAYALGVIMGLFNIIPIAGALFSMALVVLVAAIDSWGHVLAVVIFYLIYAQVETSYLTPRIMKHSVDLPGLAVVVALLIGSELAGIIGAMVSVPTAVLVAVLLEEYLQKQKKPLLTENDVPAA